MASSYEKAALWAMAQPREPCRSCGRPEDLLVWCHGPGSEQEIRASCTCCVAEAYRPEILEAVWDEGRWHGDGESPDVRRLFARHSLVLLREEFPDHELLDEDTARSLLDGKRGGDMSGLDVWSLMVLNPSLDQDEALRYLRTGTGVSRFDVLPGGRVPPPEDLTPSLAMLEAEEDRLLAFLHDAPPRDSVTPLERFPGGRALDAFVNEFAFTLSLTEQLDPKINPNTLGQWRLQPDGTLEPRERKPFGDVTLVQQWVRAHDAWAVLAMRRARGTAAERPTGWQNEAQIAIRRVQVRFSLAELAAVQTDGAERLSRLEALRRAVRAAAPWSALARLPGSVYVVGQATDVAYPDRIPL